MKFACWWLKTTIEPRNFITDVQRFHQSKKFAETMDEETRKHFPLRKIKEDPLFQPKRQSHPLIFADFCAYVWKRVLMGDTRYDRFFNPFRKQVIFFDDWADAADAKPSLANG